MGKALPLNDVPFVVVDIETTGSIPDKHAITEIGAVKVQGGRIVDRFSQLVNPGQEIPPYIQKLTGISPKMVADAPALKEVLPAFWDFLGDGVFVAHYAPFDFKFLDAVTRRQLGSGLTNTVVCTCRLAKKLLPNLRKRNLDAVSQHFNIEITERHRALGDAEATAQILLEFLAMVDEMDIKTLGKFLEFHQRGGKRYGNLKVPFPEDRVSEFPTQPGVYLMRNEKGEILYIGKAKNLKKRLQSYFYNLYRQPAKVQELMQQVMDIETRCLGSELEALLEESHLIKSIQPYYNRQIKNYRSFPFIKLTMGHTYPQLTVTTDIEDDQALYFGPYQRKRHIHNVVDSLCKVFQLRPCSDAEFRRHEKMGNPCISYEVGRCAGPCVGMVNTADYAQLVADIVAFLEGRVSTLLERMMATRAQYAEALAFEKAQRIHDRILELLKLQANTTFLARAVHQNHLLIDLPHRDSPKRLMLYVFKGRPVLKQVFDPALDTLESIWERIALIQNMLHAPSSDKPDVIAQRELEEIRIIAHWLRHREPDPAVHVWDLTDPYEGLVRRIHQVYAPQAPFSLSASTPYSLEA